VSRFGQAEERSQFYDALLDAEADAIANERGIHSPDKPTRGAALTDLSTAAAKERAKSFLSNFTRGGGMRGVVQVRKRERERYRGGGIRGGGGGESEIPGGGLLLEARTPAHASTSHLYSIALLPLSHRSSWSTPPLPLPRSPSR
jgi:hypothetical protein